jgi:hypothetical protein
VRGNKQLAVEASRLRLSENLTAAFSHVASQTATPFAQKKISALLDY